MRRYAARRCLAMPASGAPHSAPTATQTHPGETRLQQARSPNACRQRSRQRSLEKATPAARVPQLHCKPTRYPPGPHSWRLLQHCHHSLLKSTVPLYSKCLSFPPLQTCQTHCSLPPPRHSPRLPTVRRDIPVLTQRGRGEAAGAFLLGGRRAAPHVH